MHSQQTQWTYRYGPNGVREQRRLMMSPLHDSAGCTGVLPWTYYVNDPSGLVLAVYHGRQMKRSHLGDGCPDPPTPPTEPTRRVFIYPVEYRSYGPDGVNVVYERENYGVNAGQWVKRYLTTDYQGTVLQAHDVNGDHVQHYELFGAEKGQVARRTGWLDREIDWESSPLTDLYRTVDLVNRKYDPQRGVFLTSDPLWMMSADASSYHYGYHDPMNIIDPWGLDGQKDGGVGGPPPSGTGPIPGVGTSKPSTKEVTPFDHSFSFWMDGARGDYLHSVGEGALPGVGIGGGGLGPVGGSNGGTGKTDPPASSSEKWAGVPYQSGVSKFDAARNLYFGSDPVIERATKPMVITASRVSEAEHLMNDAVVLATAYMWFQFGSGQELIIDHRLVTFRAGRQGEISIGGGRTLNQLPIGKSTAVNLFDTGISVLALVAGQINVKKIGEEMFLLSTEPFDLEWRDDSSIARNVGTVFARTLLYNVSPLSPMFPIWQLPVARGGPFSLGFSGPIVIRR